MLIPPATSHRLARRLAVAAAVLIVLPVGWQLLSGVPNPTDIRLGAATPARVPASWPGVAVQDIAVERGGGLPSGTVRVGIVNPVGTPRADVLFFHGHSDRLDNHRALFTAWRDAGVRVVAFDLPEHGGTSAGALDTWDLDQLVVLASRIEQRTRTDRSRPLFLAGFSLGGELAYHAVVNPDLLAQFGRRPAGLVLLSPALAVQVFTGGDGVSRARALEHPGGAVLAKPAPAVPLANPVFTADLLIASTRDRGLSPPRDMPVFVATADPAQDTYVDVDAVRRWSARLASEDIRIDAINCPGARHAVDNEAWPIGADVRAASREYLDAVLSRAPRRLQLKDCRVDEHAYLNVGVS
jgi:alpha-beta hydrolase superfamily lysophospholipase